MSPHEFRFALALSDEARFDAMVSDLVATVLGHVGYAPDAVEELAAALHRVFAEGVASGRRECRLAFDAHDGQLQIAVAYEGAAEWRTSRALP